MLLRNGGYGAFCGSRSYPTCEASLCDLGCSSSRDNGVLGMYMEATVGEIRPNNRILLMQLLSQIPSNINPTFNLGDF